VEQIGEYAPSGYPGAVREITDELVTRQSAIAPIVGLVNAVYLGLPDGPEVLANQLRAIERRMATSAGLLSEVGAALVPAAGIVLTHGGSGSVRGMLLEADRHRSFRVSCAATRPLGEGIELAADLAGEGIPVEVVPDDQVLETLPGVDLVVVGANAFGPEQAMNVVGTGEIAQEAGELGLAVYLVASVDKALPAILFERAAAAGAATGQFEPVPLTLATAVVTEVGVLDPRAAGKLAADRQVAPELVEGG
jgi:translation initiation factor 2B subunit (eIF-2B alpha/beta/delta family)